MYRISKKTQKTQSPMIPCGIHFVLFACTKSTDVYVFFCCWFFENTFLQLICACEVVELLNHCVRLFKMFLYDYFDHFHLTIILQTYVSHNHPQWTHSGQIQTTCTILRIYTITCRPNWFLMNICCDYSVFDVANCILYITFMPMLAK